MKTYQDLLDVGQNETDRMDFVKKLISNYLNSDFYKTAWTADMYNKHRNVTINDYQKLLYTVTGRAVPDNYSANWKMATRFFHRFVLQEAQYLLGNGVAWQDKSTKDKLGADFDNKLQEAGKKALVGGIAYGFWNLDHMEVFGALEFVPLYDEEDGALKAGVRFWQIDRTKPLRATLYELDGYTDYIWRPQEDGKVLRDKTAYIIDMKVSRADGMEIYDMRNYDGFPIVPLWGNPEHQSEIVGLREQIDCYDLVKSGFASDVDDASMIYWTIQNAGGMDDVDLAKFVEHMKTVKAAVIEEEGAKAEAHTIDLPYQSREALLDRISKDLYRDAMALDVDNIASGAITATQIKAAYEPLNSKCDDFEYCVREFLNGILALVGIEGENPTFTRSALVNTSEEIQTIVAAATYLDSDYVTEKILSILGDGDRTDEMLKRMDADDFGRMSGGAGESPSFNTESRDGRE